MTEQQHHHRVGSRAAFRDIPQQPGRRLSASHRLTAGITLFGATALLGCSGEPLAEDLEQMSLDNAALGQEELGSVEQAATCTPESVKTLALDVTEPALRPAYPGVVTNSFRTSQHPLESGVINARGEVMVSLQAYGTIGSDPELDSSSRSLRWNPGNGEVKHLGLAANHSQGYRNYQGEPHAMNAAGVIVGHGISCTGFVRSTIWRGDDPSTNEFDAATNVFSLVEPAGDAPAAETQLFCDRSAAASDVDVLPEVRGSVTSQTAKAYDINDNAEPLVVGSWNGVLAATFVESAGKVVMEAERHTGTTPRGAHAWTLDGVGMRAMPNTGTNLNTGFASTSPRLDFNVHFQSTGTYTVWVKGSGPNADSDSFHVGIDEVANTSADRISGFTTVSGWSKATLDNVNASVNISKAGVHTVNVWMREDGALIDKIILTKDAAFVPNDAAPSNTLESTRHSETSDSSTHPYKWDAANGISLLSCTNGSNALPVPGGCDFSATPTSGFMVNNAGQVIARDTGSFWDTDNTLTTIADLATKSLNNQGLVVGTDVGDQEAVVILDGHALPLGVPSSRAYTWRKGAQRSDVNVPNTGDSRFWNSPVTTATAVNDRGEVAGITMVTNGFHAYVWSAATGMVDRGFINVYSDGLPEVLDINERGEILVNSSDGVFFSSPGSAIKKLRNEQTLQPYMDFALGLNDQSQVAGVAGCTGDLCTNMVVWQPEVCVPDAPQVFLEAECGTTEQGAFATLQTSSTRGAFSGPGYIVSAAATPTSPTLAADQSSYSVNIASAGNYVLYFRAHTNASANDDSWFYQIDSNPWITMNNNLQTGFAWYAGNAGVAVNLSAGAHTIRVANRENGLALDKLALVLSGAPAPTGLGAEASNCGAPPPVLCGNGVCDASETCNSCSSDCFCSNFTIMSATFDNYATGNNDGFTFVSRAFGTSGLNAEARGADTGRLNVRMGLNPLNTTTNSAAFTRAFQLPAASTVTVRFDYSLSMADAFEVNECGEVRVRLGNTFYGNAGNPWVVRRCDGGTNSGSFEFTTAMLAAGSYTLELGGYLNDNSAADETTEVRFDNVTITGREQH